MNEYVENNKRDGFWFTTACLIRAMHIQRVTSQWVACALLGEAIVRQRVKSYVYI